MPILCSLGFHSWEDRTCKRCGEVKETEEYKYFKSIAVPQGPEHFILSFPDGRGIVFHRSSETAKAILLIKDVAPYLSRDTTPESMANILTMHAEKGRLARPQDGVFYPWDAAVEACLRVVQKVGRN